MSKTEADKSRGFRGLVEIEIEDDYGNVDEYEVKCLRMKDIALVLESMEDESFDEAQSGKDFTPGKGEMVGMLNAIVDAATSMLKRTTGSVFEELEEDTLESIVVNNFKAFSDSVMAQTKKLMQSDRHASKVNKIKLRDQGGRHATGVKPDTKTQKESGVKARKKA